MPEQLSHPSSRERVIVGFIPVAGILSTRFGSTSLPCGAKELLTSGQVTLCAGMRWEVMLDWDVFLFPAFLPFLFAAPSQLKAVQDFSSPQTQMCTPTVFSGYTTPERLHNPASTSSSTPVQQQRNEREDIALCHGVFAMNSGLGKVRGLLCPDQSQIINLLLQSLQNEKKEKKSYIDQNMFSASFQGIWLNIWSQRPTAKNVRRWACWYLHWWIWKPKKVKSFTL